MKNNFPSDEGLDFDEAFPPAIKGSLIMDKIAEHERDYRAEMRRKALFMALTITQCLLIGWVLRALIFS